MKPARLNSNSHYLEPEILIDELAPGGGFVFAPVHNIQSEVPAENVVTMFETARRHGIY